MRKALSEEQKARARERSKVWRINNPNRAKTSQALWRTNNKQRKAANDHAWYEANKDKKASYDKDYFQANREKKMLQSKQWAEAHPEKVRLYKQRTAKKHFIEWRLWCHARRTKTTGHKIVKEEIYNWDSRICGICQLTIESKFHLDHIIPLSKGGKHEVSNLQLAHPFCNLSKFNKILVTQEVI